MANPSRQSLRCAWIVIVCKCRNTGLAVLVFLAALIWDAAQRGPAPPVARAVWPMPAVSPSVSVDALVPTGSGFIPMPGSTPAAHSSSLLAMPQGHPAVLMAFWFAGSGESAPDVQIAASGFDRTTQRWLPAQCAVDRRALGAALGFGVRRLGNPVAWLDGQGRVHLFVVATGLGGWAASRVVHLRQSGTGPIMRFDLVRVLPLSWLWNTSFLVRTAPLPLQDGGMVLPVYFELGAKYPAALRFDAEGQFVSMVRISRRGYLLQPTLVMQNDRQWLALMRDQRPEGRVAAAQTQDGGQSWSDLPDLTLTNPNASVAGMGIAPGQMVLVHNSSPQARYILDLSRSSDGVHWQRLARLADGHGAGEYSYPALAWADGSLWVSYTHLRQRIAWQRLGMKQ